MKFKSLLVSVVAVCFAVMSCDLGIDIPDQVKKDYPIDFKTNLAVGSDVGVTIEVKKVEDQNFIFELRPGAMVRSFKLDVYPLASLYNSLLNDKNAGELVLGDAVAINERIREYLFTDGSGGYAFSVDDFDNPEDFLQIEYDWMSTPYASNTAIAIPDCEYVIAVVASTDPDISSANQEQLTLCYLRTTSRPLEGDPQAEIEVQTGYRAFKVSHHLNNDAAGVYYFGRLASEIDEYADTFGDRLMRDFVRTYYAAPITPDNEIALSYSKSYGQAADHTLQSATIAVAVDANLTPQEGYSRQDFSLEEIPAEGAQEAANATVTIVKEKVAASYYQFKIEMNAATEVFFYRTYTEEAKEVLEAASNYDKKMEAIDLQDNGAFACVNPNFSWNADAPVGERATGFAATVLEADFKFGIAPGSTVYVGYTLRNGYGALTPIAFSEAIKLDELNLTTPADYSVAKLNQKVSEVSRTSIQHVISYDPENVAMLYYSYMTPDNNPGLTVDSSWKEWAAFMFSSDEGIPAANINLMVDPNRPDGLEPTGWTGLQSNTEYTFFAMAEDFDGNLSPMSFTTAKTVEAQIGPNPTMGISVKKLEDGSYQAVYSIDKDVKSFKYWASDDVSVLNIPGTNMGTLNNMAGSGIGYDRWHGKIFDYVYEYGLESESLHSYSEPWTTTAPVLIACVATGDETSEPTLFCYLFKDGKLESLESIFGHE